MPDWIEPNWPPISGVHAAFSLRTGGVSSGEFSSLNLATHVEDALPAVEENRRLITAALALPGAPAWLNQVHGTQVAAAHQIGTSSPAADASWTDQAAVVCAVLVADCLPVLIADRQSRAVAAVHAGWRSLQAGVLAEALQCLRQHADCSSLQAWLGPCIGPSAFEVGEDVRSAFVRARPGWAQGFEPGRPGHWMADLRVLATQEFERLGVERVYNSTACTFTDAEQFFSFRRDKRCGRMGAFIWRD